MEEVTYVSHRFPCPQVRKNQQLILETTGEQILPCKLSILRPLTKLLNFSNQGCRQLGMDGQKFDYTRTPRFSQILLYGITANVYALALTLLGAAIQIKIMERMAVQMARIKAPW